MFTTVIVIVALVAAAWTTWRISHIEDMDWFKRIGMFILFALIWMVPILIRDRGVFSGPSYTVIYYLLYFIFVWNAFYFGMVAIRDIVWGAGYLYRWSHNRLLGWFDFYRIDLLYRSTFVFICISFFLAAFSFYCGTKTPDVRQIIIPTNKISANMTIVVLSDLHLNRIVPVSKIRNIVNKVNDTYPDIIVFPGDTIDDTIEHIRPHLAELSHLRAKMGKFAISGNHEFYTGHNEARTALRMAGITYLFNEGVQITPEVYLAGIPDHSTVRKISDSADIMRALFSAEDAHYKLLLSHRPNFIDTLQPGLIDLQLSGHTHGAQIFPMHIIVKLTHDYLSGLYDTPNGKLYVSRGSGQWGPQMRFLAPSEITVINLAVAPSVKNKNGRIGRNLQTAHFLQKNEALDITWHSALNDMETKLVKNEIDVTAPEKQADNELVDMPDFVEMLNISDKESVSQMVALVDKTKLLPLKPQSSHPSSEQSRKGSKIAKKAHSSQENTDTNMKAKQAFEDAKASLESDLSKIITKNRAKNKDMNAVSAAEKETVATGKHATDDAKSSQTMAKTKKKEIKTVQKTTSVKKSGVSGMQREDVDSEMIVFIDNRPVIPTVKVYDGNKQEKIADSTVEDSRNVETKTVQNPDGSVTKTEIVTETKHTPTGHTTRRTVRVVTSYPEKPIERGTMPAKKIKADKRSEPKPIQPNPVVRSVYTMVHPVYGYQYVVAPQVVQVVPQEMPVPSAQSDMTYPVMPANTYNAVPAYQGNMAQPVVQIIPAYNQSQGTVWYYPSGY